MFSKRRVKPIKNATFLKVKLLIYETYTCNMYREMLLDNKNTTNYYSNRDWVCKMHKLEVLFCLLKLMQIELSKQNFTAYRYIFT